jgi:hypothetical protein
VATETFEKSPISTSDPVELDLFVGEGNLTHECYDRQARLLKCVARRNLELLSSGSSGPSVPSGRKSYHYFTWNQLFFDDNDPLGGRKDLTKFLERIFSARRA